MMRCNYSSKLLLLALIMFSTHLFGQGKEFKGDPDKAFEKARNLAFNKERKKAQDSLLFILTKYPDYHDIRAFLGSTYSWDKRYEEARKEFLYVLNKDPQRKSTWVAAIKNELWGDFPFKASELVNTALKYYPENVEILYLRASSERDSGDWEKAFESIKTLLKKYPNYEDGINFKERLIKDKRFNTIGIKTNVDLYSEVFDPMQLHSLKYSRKTKLGSIIVRANFGRRFQKNGVQYEIDMYPKIVKGLYAYMNVGFSNTSLFPEVRYGSELYKSLPNSFEASLGFRGLKYSRTTTIYTGSIGWYTGNSYWSFRPYVTPGDDGTSVSGTLNYRKYRSNGDNYFSIAAGIGFSPEIYRFDFENNENEIIKLKSQKVNIGYYFTTNNDKNMFGSKLGVTHQEISFDVGNYFWIYSLSLSWDVRFR